MFGEPTSALEVFLGHAYQEINVRRGECQLIDHMEASAFDQPASITPADLQTQAPEGMGSGFIGGSETGVGGAEPERNRLQPGFEVVGRLAGG